MFCLCVHILSLNKDTIYLFSPDMSRFHLVCFFFVFKEVHLYRAQLHTPTGFLHFYRGETGTR